MVAILIIDGAIPALVVGSNIITMIVNKYIRVVRDRKSAVVEYIDDRRLRYTLA